MPEPSFVDHLKLGGISGAGKSSAGNHQQSHFCGWRGREGLKSMAGGEHPLPGDSRGFGADQS